MKMMCVINVLRLLIVLIIGSTLGAAAAINYRHNSLYEQPDKRPFCNAFTGCGRKRSGSIADAPPPADRMQLTDMSPSSTGEKLNDLIDLHSEPAVEDLMRQIMSQAKLWEAIQEAHRDLQQQDKDASMAFSAQ